MTDTQDTAPDLATEERDRELFADLDDDALLLAVDAASAEDRKLLAAELRRRGLET